MRSFQLLFWLIFIGIYTVLSFSSVQITLQLISRDLKKRFKIILLLWSLSVLITMLLLYIWPGDVRNSNNYSLYFIFNGILFLDIIVKTPLFFFFILSLFFKNKYSKKVVSNLALILSAVLGFTICYGIVAGRNAVVVNQVELEFENLPKPFDGYKLIQISDIHLGSFGNSTKLMEKVAKQISAENAGLILFTGDMVNNFSDEIDGWSALFNQFNTAGRSYSILGNHDYGNYSSWSSDEKKDKNFQAIIKSHSDFGFQLLRNQHQKIRIDKDSIYLIGVENWGHPPFPQYAKLEQAMAGIPKNTFKILMSHDPAHWEEQITDREDIALTLSGHTHGLQFGFHPAGISFSPSYFVRQNWGGLYKGKSNYLYVNKGLGTVGVPWRIDMPAEITAITLKRIEID